MLRQRAAILQHIRQFFLTRNVLEVETPSLSRHTITDPYLQALSTLHTEPGATSSTQLYLQTSPEYAMKRLLAAGSGDIFQLAKVFRDDEVGRLHNPEFTMLEWYRIGFDMQALIDEVAALLMLLLPIDRVEQATYSQLFERFCHFNPIAISVSALISQCTQRNLTNYVKSLQQSLASSDFNEILLKDSLLQVLFNQEIEPHIGQHVPMVVTHFPASQASLASLAEDSSTANRFEVYFKKIELANGFHELTDPNSQKARFEADNQQRSALGLPQNEIDQRFIGALQKGLPPCAGVAVGIDRLIMLALNKTSIRDVLSFDYYHC